MGRPPSKGKQRIQIRRIEEDSRRQVTFSKRKAGVLKKACELSLLCDAAVAVVVFSAGARKPPPPPEAGNPSSASGGSGRAFGVGNPSVDHVLRRLDDPRLPAPEGVGGVDPAAHRAAVEATLRRIEETRALVAAEEARMRAVRERVLQAVAGRRFWWEADVEALGEAELPDFARALRRLQATVQRHADNKLAQAAQAGGAAA
ncbi:hypothetical protein ACP4OV_013055 [Aristida adscensionis]